MRRCDLDGRASLGAARVRTQGVEIILCNRFFAGIENWGGVYLKCSGLLQLTLVSYLCFGRAEGIRTAGVRTMNQTIQILGNSATLRAIRLWIANENHAAVRIRTVAIELRPANRPPRKRTGGDDYRHRGAARDRLARLRMWLADQIVGPYPETEDDRAMARRQRAKIIPFMRCDRQDASIR
jgi:hypothetical protein